MTKKLGKRPPKGEKLPIDKNIPVPSDEGDDSPYPFNTMEVGDSFMDDFTHSTTLQKIIDTASRKYGFEFYREPWEHSTPDGTMIGYRVWRIR